MYSLETKGHLKVLAEVRNVRRTHKHFSTKMVFRLDDAELTAKRNGHAGICRSEKKDGSVIS